MSLSTVLVFLTVVLVVIVALALLSGLLQAKFGGLADSSGPSKAYELRRSIFTAAERSFAGVLDGALPEGVTWFAKVRLGDIFITKKGLSRSESTTARNRIDRKHVDFLLLRSSDLAPLAGIELDDRSHNADDRKQRDAFCRQRLPLLLPPASPRPSAGIL